MCKECTKKILPIKLAIMNSVQTSLNENRFLKEKKFACRISGK